MFGAICKRDILAHPFVTIRCFGWRVFFKSLFAGRDQTFLSLLNEADVLKPAGDVLELVSRCVDLELRAKKIYETYAARFAQQMEAKRFFESMARQEQGHSELLSVCREAARRERWNDKLFAPWRDAVPKLEEKMESTERRVAENQELIAALQHVIEIESSEINHIFDAVVRATDSEFVRRLQVFRTTEIQHIKFICRAVTQLEPSLMDACRDMREKYLGPAEATAA
jgi:rubrerythrin